MKSVRGLVLMTYDFSVNQGKQGPNAPVQWLQNVMQTVDKKLNRKFANRVMIGLNFYGYQFEPDSYFAATAGIYNNRAGDSVGCTRPGYL